MEDALTGEVAKTAEAVRQAVGKAVKGLDAQVNATLVAFMAGGHVLIEGPPGTGKTLLARALAKSLGLSHARVQFTPDLTPTDIIGATVYERSSERFRFEKGPVFTDILLADEINRAPPKTQAALLEAMQERSVSVNRESMELGRRFFVMATENPVEMEGTYPLPEAQLDRFMMKLAIDSPALDAELEILRSVRDGARSDILDLSAVTTVTDAAAVDRLRETVRVVTVEDAMLGYIASIVRGTREAYGVELGCSPRAGVALLAAARAAAAMEGRGFVVPDDVKSLAPAVLPHRVIVTAEAELEGLRPAEIVRRVLESVEVPR